tara:strand:+ start:21 stop:515 length:495 start_codon:yes stop_codon:yes gene_type:complete
MTPKSLLRHKEAISTMEELCDGSFNTVMPEIDPHDPQRITRVVLCSGKVYFDLLSRRREKQLHNVAIIRVEQLYPFPEADLAELLANYPNVNIAVWCQEEPINQGAWYSSQHHIRRVIHSRYPSLYLHYAGREGSASPAAGYMSLHVRQQENLVHQALYVEDLD